jgi:hypothetical protein
MSSRRLSVAVKGILHDENKLETSWNEDVCNTFMRYTIEIFPHRNFFNILDGVNLTCKIYFPNDCSSEEYDVPQTAKDHVSFDFHGPDYGEPDRIILRQNPPLSKKYIKSQTWLLDCMTGIIRTLNNFPVLLI